MFYIILSYIIIIQKKIYFIYMYIYILITYSPYLAEYILRTNIYSKQNVNILRIPISCTMNDKIIPSFIERTIMSYHSRKYFRMTLIRAHLYPWCVIILGDFQIRARVTSRGCYQSLVYQVRRYT